MSREERDGKPVWISLDESDEERVERQYRVLNLHGVGPIWATVWDGNDFDPAGALGVSLFNDTGFRVWSTVVGFPVMDDPTDRDAVAEACRQLKLQRRGRVDIEPFGFDVKEPDPHSATAKETARRAGEYADTGEITR